MVKGLFSRCFFCHHSVGHALAQKENCVIGGASDSKTMGLTNIERIRGLEMHTSQGPHQWTHQWIIWKATILYIFARLAEEIFGNFGADIFTLKKFE